MTTREQRTEREQGTAICIIRMEPQPVGMLISVRVNGDIREVSGERHYHFTDPDNALGAVRDFVARVVDGHVLGREDADPEPPEYGG
ncbi:hypothetical protein [Actinopolymorpha rutila]|uniref:Uncharacterized protein n=1 Tax=Actinopolymorpha rutila TaxID=446787 RepID=A0A852ZEV3_9ACTN|nr:hypothetical protein [Actinopolymorpha rutila]NYH90813.1 hypothetical protein [Actinopolymorpha rutila]